jgi:thymidine kinase
MADLIFYTGPMGSAKTAQALMTQFQYKERGNHVWLIKPALDTRETTLFANGHPVKTLVKSRIGIEAWADVIETDASIVVPAGINLIICDEAQFLTAKQVEELKLIADSSNIQVFCYGLKTDFTSHLFEGSKRLLELASKTVELPVVCDCGNAAVINARLVDNKVVTEGEQIDIGGDEKYKAFCYSCWKELQK